MREELTPRAEGALTGAGNNGGTTHRRNLGSGRRARALGGLIGLWVAAVIVMVLGRLAWIASSWVLGGLIR